MTDPVDQAATDNALYKQLVENQNNLVVKFDAGGHMLYANPAYLETFGKKADEIIGTQFFSLIHEEDQNEIITSLKKTLTPPYITEHRGRARTVSGLRWFNWRATGIPNSEGKVESIISFGQDITRQVEAEEELKKIQHNLLEAQRIGKTGSWEWDLQADVLWWSEGMYNISGRDPDDGPLGEEEWYQHIHPEDRERVQKSVKEAYQSGNYEIEYRIYRIDNGEERIFEANGEVICDEQGEPVLFRGILTDITERRLQEIALRDSEERFRTSFEDSIVAMVIVNNRGVFISVNQAACAMFGYSEEEFLSKNYLDITHPEDRERSQQRFLQCLEDRRPYNIQKKYLHKDGKTIISLTSISPIIGPHSQNPYFIAHLQDITEREKATEAVIREKNKAQQYLDVVESIILALDKNQCVILANRTCCEVLGYTEEEILGKHWTDYFIPEHNKANVNEVWENILAGKIQEEEYVEDLVLTKSGEERIIAWHNAILKDEFGNITGTLSSGQDITERKHAEDALIQEKNKARQYLDIAEVMILATDTDQRITLANRKCCEVLGYEKEEEILGKVWTENFTLPEDMDLVNNIMTKPLQDESQLVEYSENALKTKNGERRMIAWQNALLKDRQGNIIGMLSSGQDITERKQVQLALQESEERFRRLFEDAPFGAAITSFDYKFRSVNKAFCRMTGYTAEELTQFRFSDITHPEDVEKDLQKVQELASGEIDQYNVSKRYIRKDGKTIWVNLAVRLIKDQYGNPLHFLPMMEDITERKQAEEALIQEKNKAQQYLDIAEVIIVALDKDQRITLANRKCCEVLGYTDEHEILGKNWSENFIPPESKAFVSEVWNKVMGGKFEMVEYGENYIIDKNGNKRMIAWHNAMVRNEHGEIIGALSSGQDITKRKEVEEAIQNLNRELEERVDLRTAQLRGANKELEAFSYSVSHDLQAPLRAIRGFSEIIELENENRLPQDVLENLSRIKAATIRMNQLINGLLDLSHMGQKTLKIEPIQIDPLAEMIYNELLEMEKGRQVDFTTATNATIQGDRDMVTILLRNLIGNALKYTRMEPKAVIKLECTRIEDEEVFCISDNGIGFNMEFSDKLFQPFQRLHAEPIFEGTGIGLSLCKRIIQHHNGKIWVESEEGKGTTFYFTFGDPTPPVS